MSSTILLPTSQTEQSESAVNFGLTLAESMGATVHALSVIEVPPELDTLDSEQQHTIRASLEQQARAATTRILEQAQERGIEASDEVVEGSPDRCIVEAAEEQAPEYIVMGTRARTRTKGIGSTTERVLFHSPTSVIASPLDGMVDEESSIERIVIATDGSDSAERAAEHGFDLAELFDAGVYITYIIDPTTYRIADAPRSILGLLKEGGQNAVEELSTSARERNLKVTTSVRRGSPEEEILAFSDEADGDVTVLGVSGRGGVDNRFLGSTTARVLRKSTRPILTVH